MGEGEALAEPHWPTSFENRGSPGASPSQFFHTFPPQRRGIIFILRLPWQHTSSCAAVLNETRPKWAFMAARNFLCHARSRYHAHRLKGCARVPPYWRTGPWWQWFAWTPPSDG